MAIERVAQRVRSGGHAIPVDVIHRRYGRSLLNLFQLYRPICDLFLLVNNSGASPVQVARGGKANTVVVYEQTLWEKLKNDYGSQREN